MLKRLVLVGGDSRQSERQQPGCYTARRFQVPLPENPPWWKAFDADKSGIDDVCRILAHLYSLPKAQYIPVSKDGASFTFSNKSSLESMSQSIPQSSFPTNNTDTSVEANIESIGSKGALVKLANDKLKDGNKSDDESRGMDKARDRDRTKPRDRVRGRDSNKEREREEAERDRLKDCGNRSRKRARDSGYSEKAKHHSSRDRDYHSSSYSSREKDQCRHH